MSQNNPPQLNSQADILDALTRDGLPPLDHPQFEEYVETLAAYRAAVREPVRAKLESRRAHFEFPEGSDSTAILDAARRRCNAARRAYAYKTFTLSQQIDAAAALELAEGMYWIIFDRWAEAWIHPGFTETPGWKQYCRWHDEAVALRSTMPWREWCRRYRDDLIEENRRIAAVLKRVYGVSP